MLLNKDAIVEFDWLIADGDNLTEIPHFLFSVIGRMW